MSGVQNATTQPVQCIQASVSGSPGLSTSNPFRTRSDVVVGDLISNEDCLFLNVHVPSNVERGAQLPVVFWIHSGGYDGGNNSAFPVQDFVKQSNYGVVSVQVQYRLGLFGFMPGQQVKDGGDLNVGLLDQQFALQWVQDHIASFGGDPQKVTIWGQSSGAGSVLQHIVAHGGRTNPPLFRATIMSSPFLPFQYHYNDPIPEMLYAEVVAQVNCTGSSDTLACLRAANASDLVQADTAIGSANFLGTYTFVPVVDEEFIVERPTETLNRLQVNGETLLAITNSHEGDLFVNATAVTSANLTLAEYVTQLFPRLNHTQVQHAVGLYSRIGLQTVVEQAEAVMGDSIFVCPAYYALEGYGRGGWKGEFAIPPGTHAEDLSYEFITFAIRPTYNNTAFINAFSESFMSFAISLDPNVHVDPSDIKPTWATWGLNSTEMLFNKTESGVPVVQPFETDAGLLERCQ
ncbi:hypothetical protein EW146_g1764 [Bondarzewia mesenterica]|uniref:Carboxylic ester hydrolase n=1 Tax=Bondarzewia mesenterica TaxID=1095465 RepID=A0A4S4M4B5_9AGAM|nr:hypothetical protein EW146_g1764 [Bondarzewia mesenterica]